MKAEKKLSLRDDSGVVGYVPGDLTLVVRAGTTLSEIESVTGEHDQWLPLDPFGTNDGTLSNLAHYYFDRVKTRLSLQA